MTTPNTQAQDAARRAAELLFPDYTTSGNPSYQIMRDRANDAILAAFQPVLDDLRAKLAAATEAIRVKDQALSLINVTCENVHHNKKDQHTWSQPCPVVARIEKALATTPTVAAQWEEKP